MLPKFVLLKAMLKEGRKAPAFNLPASTGGKIALKDLKGQYAVIYFYPKDNTPGCTTEAQGFRDAAEELEQLNAVVLGVSKDSIASHCRFSDKHDLGFALLSDESGKMLEKYEAWGEKKMYGKTFMGIIRSTVVLSPEGKVLKHFPKVRVKGHVEAVLEVLRAENAA